MVIKCPRCSSRYKIDAAGVPDEGTYARCRKCENVFFVRKRSREEVSLLRKSIRKRKDAEATPFAAHETPRLPESIIEAAEDSTAEEGQFLARPQVVSMVEERAMETGVDERAGTGESDAGRHDVEAMLAAYSQKTPEAGQAPNAMPISGVEEFSEESGSANMGQMPPAAEFDNIEEAPLNFSHDDIEALLAAHSPAKRTKADEPVSMPLQNQTEDLLSEDATKLDIRPTIVISVPAQGAKKEESSSPISQDDIEALLAANAPKSVPQAAKKEESGSPISQDDIEALLAANAPKSVPQAAKAAPSLSKGEPTSGFDQNSIDSLFAANAPGDKEAQTPAAISGIQDDIDALLAANSPLAQSSMKAAAEGQNEIDALLASAMGKPAPKPTAETATPPKASGEILSQSDLDSLLSQTGEISGPRKDAGTISELEIDSILDAAGIAESERGDETPAGKAIDDGLLSQDTLDSLLAEASQEDTGGPIAQAASEQADDELERLLSGEEDSLGEALFQDGSKTPSSTGEPSLDEMLAGELTPRKPAHAPDDDHEHAGAMQGVFAQGEVSFSEIEEETTDEEAHAKKKGFNPLAIFAPVIAALRKALGIIPIPKFKFVGAIFQKLPPRLAGVMSGLALAVAVGAIGGGWWLLKGEQARDETQVAQKEADHKPAAKPAAPSAAPVPAQPPAVAQVAPPAPAPRPSEVFAKAPSSGKYPVSFVVYLPVEFDAETTKILNMNVELVFESEMVAKIVRERLFFSAVTVEKTIDGFFRDKFYEETVFAQDKLEEFLAQNLKTVKQFAGLSDVRLSAFSID